MHVRRFLPTTGRFAGSTKSVAEHVVDLADDVVLMDYTRDVDSAWQRAEPFLVYADASNDKYGHNDGADNNNANNNENNNNENNNNNGHARGPVVASIDEGDGRSLSLSSQSPTSTTNNITTTVSIGLAICDPSDPAPDSWCVQHFVEWRWTV